MESTTLEVNVTKPRCPFCHENVEAKDRKWGCPSCMAWQHEDCHKEISACAACGSLKKTLVTPTLTGETLISGGIKLSAIITQNKEPRAKDTAGLDNLVKELRFLEKSLLENLKEHDLESFVYPRFQGLVFESRVAPPSGYDSMGLQDNTELFVSYNYLIKLYSYSTNNYVYPETTFLKTPHYKSLHQVSAKGSTPYYYKPEKGPLFDLLQIQYFIVRDTKDPYNSGRNLPVIAYAEENYHFLIQLLHDLLLPNKMGKHGPG